MSRKRRSAGVKKRPAAIPEAVIPEIIVDDGIQRIPIRNRQGDEIGVFCFRPTDIGIVDRYNEMISKFDEITAPLENIGVTPEGDAPDDATQEQADALKEAQKRLFEVCDYMFDGNLSEAFFGKMNPFSPVNGRFYCENALEAVGKYISAQFDHEVKTISARAAKYTKGYTPYPRPR